MLAEAVEIETDLIGQFDFLQQVFQPAGGRLQMPAVERVGGIFGE